MSLARSARVRTSISVLLDNPNEEE